MWIALIIALAGATAPPDQDGDGVPDAVELVDGTDPDLADTDGDGVPDGVERTDGDLARDTDGDGVIDGRDLDDDDDGIPTHDELHGWDWTAPGAGDPPGSDADGMPDYLDPDSDNDGDPDVYEGTGDADCDGIPNWIDADDRSGDCDTGAATATGAPLGTGAPWIPQDTAEPEPEPDSRAPRSQAQRGCSCATSPAAPSGLVWVLAVAATLRRRYNKA